MSYIDPREMTKNPENGFMLEGDNRVEEMYNWSGKILDLCDLPVEEYMKPMQVIVLGSGELPETGTTQYTLKFVVDGETVNGGGKGEKISSGEPIPFSINAEKEGRNFIGWYYNGKEYKEGDSMPSRNLTLTAKYECDVKFVFVIDGVGEELSAYTTAVAYNSKLTNIPPTSKEGYEFKGWEPSINNPVTSHTVYYATFESIVYVVTWNGYVDGPIIQEYKYNDTLNQPINPEKEGYKFINWNEAIPEKVTSNLVFTAKFEVNKYVLSYYISIDGIEGEAVSSTTLAFASTIPSKKKPIKSGYTFTDWIGYNAETNEVFEGTKMPAYNVKYVSERTTNQYTVKYFDNNELVHEKKYFYGQVITPYVYEKEGWTVSEWSNLPETMPYYDIDVHCTSVINSYKVIFMDEEGNILYETIAEYGTKIEKLVPSFEGKTYTISDDILNATVKAEDMEIYGKLTINEYEVTIIVDNNKQDIVKLPYGSNVDEYILANYKPEEGYSMEYSPMNITVPANNSLVINVNYNPNIHILSYTTTGADNNNFKGKVNVAYGETILDKLPNKEFEGYDFKGWFNEENKVDEDDTMPNGNISVNGIYEIMSFIVIVKDGQTEVLNKEYTYGTKLQVVLDDIKEYRDNLYNEGYETNVNINAEDIIKSAMEFEIERTEREFVLTFMNGENIISSAMVKYNATIVYPEMSGYIENDVEYVFVWKDDSRNGQPMPMEDVIIVGNYVEKPAAPIYYGVFVTSATSPDSKIYNDSDLGMYFKTVNVSECFEEKEVDIFMDADKTAIEFIENDDWDGFDEYCASHLYPSCFLIPVEVIEKYDFVAVLKADGAQKNFTSDNKPLNINGSNYYLYTYLNPDSMMAGDGPQTFTYKITLK